MDGIIMDGLGLNGKGLSTITGVTMDAGVQGGCMAVNI